MQGIYFSQNAITESKLLTLDVFYSGIGICILITFSFKVDNLKQKSTFLCIFVVFMFADILNLDK